MCVPFLLRCGLVISLSLMVGQRVAGDDWQSYQHDPAHTGATNDFINAAALTLAWTAPTGYSTPLILGNNVYATQNQQGIGGSSTNITSFALANGAVNWTYTGNFVFPSQAAVGGGFVVFHGGVGGGGNQLYVLNSNTGAFLYTVPVPGGIDVMPTVVTNQLTGAVTAYCADGSTVRAVQLGATSGSVLWTQSGSFGGSSIPTVVGNSVVLAGPGQYYAFDQATGAPNHFQNGGISGGGGTTVAYDIVRNQFYVLEDYNSPTATLSAYHYTDNNNISLLWQRTGAGVGNGGSVAIGIHGEVYSVGNSVIWELNAITGATLRFIPGTFANAVTPALTAGVLWAFSENQTLAYDLTTLQLLRSLNGSRGSLNSTYDSPGAFSNGYFALDYGTIFGSHGFDVYFAPVPEPSVIALFTIAVIVVARARRQS